MRSIVLSIFSAVTFCFGAFAQQEMVVSDSLSVMPLSENLFMHVSRQTDSVFGRFTSNGLLYVIGDEAILIDTPPSEAQALQLYAWFMKTFPKARLTAVIVTHFHSDCLGGLKVFHRDGITSYGHALTPVLLAAKQDTLDAPINTFHGKLSLPISGRTVLSFYPGEAHTRDNIVTWIESEKVLFGGCMVKALQAGKGNVADANLAKWSATVEKVKQAFPAARIVVPGHGATGGPELLDYTIRLFSAEN